MAGKELNNAELEIMIANGGVMSPGRVRLLGQRVRDASFEFLYIQPCAPVFEGSN